MNRRLALFALVAVIQLAATGTSIALYESTLRRGTSLRLRLAPVDPIDPLRGRYVRLRFEAETTDAEVDAGDTYYGPAHAILTSGTDGFATVSRIVVGRPSHGDFLPVWVSYETSESKHLRFPIDRFYANERVAPAIERRFASPNAPEAYAVVRVLEGRAVIESLVIEGRDAVTGRPVPMR